MQKEYRRLQQEKTRLEKVIDELPAGKLILCANGVNNTSWFVSDGHKKEYLKRKEREFAQKLAYKKVLQLQVEEIEQEMQAINFYLRHHQASEGNAVKLLSNPAYTELLEPYFKLDDQELQEWMDSPYQRNELFPEGLIFKTNTGITVRSKSEMLIVMLLHMKKIPFRYECLLKLGDSIYYPDFTIKHPKTGKIFYWEHFGQMDKPEYVKGVFPKLHAYANYGIVQGVNLIATFETKDYPLEVDMVEKLIDYYFT